MSIDSQNHILTERVGAVAVIRLNRLERNNALSLDLLRAMNEVLTEAENDPKVHVIVLTSAGKSFCEGADIDEIADIDDSASAQRIDYLSGDWEHIDSCTKPIIAAVAGYAVGGGCELALMCDIIIAAENARFGQPEIKLGLMPGGGATQRLPRLIGKSRAMELCLTGKIITAQEAKQIGLVSSVVPTNQLLEKALEMADIIAKYSQPTVQLIKKAVKIAQTTELEVGLKKERTLFHSTFDLHDQKEGIQAFKQNQPPNFEQR